MLLQETIKNLTFRRSDLKPITTKIENFTANIQQKVQWNNTSYLFKKLLFTMKNATAADSNQSNISRIYI